MDKYEYKVKLAQIEKLATKKDYVTAAKIADGIDWRKVKSVTTLTLIADIYEANNRLEDCYELLNMVYDRSPIGRGVVYRMTEIATKMHDFEEAIDLYKEFVKIAPHDLSKYILKYQIYRERGSSVADQIVILEEFKSHEYDERWAFELACLYEEAGMIDRCIEECDELILWFSEGEYVAKAMELKMKYQDLSASQQEKFEHRYDYLEPSEPEEYYDEDDDETLDVISEDTLTPAYKAAEAVKHPLKEEDDTPKVSEINMNKFSTMNLQEELAKGLQQLLAQAEEEALEEAKAKPDTQEFQSLKEKVDVPVQEEKKQVTEVPKTVKEVSKSAQEISQPEEVSKPVVVKENPKLQPVQEERGLSETAELQTEILKYAAVVSEPKMEQMLRTEEDGQMTLDIGEENILEKQITGQMTIGEILEAWEEKKRQAREKMELSDGKRHPVLFETGEISSLLQDFIPRTPKDVQEMIDEIEAEKEVPTSVVEAEPVTVPESVVTPEPVVMPGPEFSTEPQELEDDLPLDIDFEEALEEVLAMSLEKEAPITNKIAEEKVITAVSEETVNMALDTSVEKPEEVSIPVISELEKVSVPVADEPEKEKISQNTASMLDAIERALAIEIAPKETAGNYLTEEQEKIFAYFTSVNGMKKQLVNLLGEDENYEGKEDSKEGNLIITGHPGNGKTTLAIDIVKAIQKQRREKGGKLAKVTGDGMNKKNPEDVVKKLGGGALIIERAGNLNDETVEKLSLAMEGITGGLLVILEDDAKEIANLMDRHYGFSLKFNRFVDIPIFSNDELVAFGRSYAEEKEYYFDEMAVLALYDSIGVRQTSDHVVNITEVKEFVDDAIAHAEKKGKGLFARLSKKRLDEYGNKLLLEEDFDY